MTETKRSRSEVLWNDLYSMNLPNKLTVGRFFLAIVFFILLSSDKSLVLDCALAIFLIAGLTDALDGYLARKHNLLTDFGRIVDPFVDKIIICGAFLFLAGKNTGTPAEWLVRPWMVTVIIAREFLVSGLRGMVESKGIAFGSNPLGKTKMAIQFATVCVCLFFLAHLKANRSAFFVVSSLLWLTVLVTIASGMVYAFKCRGILRGDNGS